MVRPFCLIRPWKSDLNTLLCQRSCYYISTITSNQSLNDASAIFLPPALAYHRKSCGMSFETASVISKKIDLTTTENAEAVLKLLRIQGFTNAQIERLISTRPRLLLPDPEKILKPNFKAFASLGLTGSNVISLVMRTPSMLECKAEFVVEFFRKKGFSYEQVLKMSMKCPVLLSLNADKILKPKVDFLESLKMSGAQIRSLLIKDPSILTRSLENRIKPSVRVLKRFVGDDVNVVKAINKTSWTLRYDLEKMLEPNLLFLKDVGVPRSVILKVFLNFPPLLLTTVDKLNSAVRYVKTLDIDPSKHAFAKAVYCKLVQSEAKWNQKLKALISFGLTEEEVLTAVRKTPPLMLLSEEKVKKAMAFFVKELKIKPDILVTDLFFVQFSLKKRVLPRCSVMQLLVSKKVVKTINLHRILRYSEKEFVDLIVNKYLAVVPDIVRAYEGKIDFKGFPDGYWHKMTYHIVG